MHRLIAALAVLVFASSALAADFQSQNYTGNDAGYLVMSIRHDRAIELPLFALNFRTEDRSAIGFVAYRAPGTVLGKMLLTPDTTVGDDIVTVVAHALPPGGYAFYRIGTYEGVGLRFEMPFTIKTGETTYLGEFRASSWSHKREVLSSILAGSFSSRQEEEFAGLAYPHVDAEQISSVFRAQPSLIIAQGHIGGLGLPVEDTGATPPGAFPSASQLRSGYFFSISSTIERDIEIARLKKGLPAGRVTASVPDTAALDVPLFRMETNSRTISGATISAFSDGRFAMSLSNTAGVNARVVKSFSTAIANGDLWPYYQVEALNSRGIAHLRMRRFDEAIADFSQAIKIDRLAFAAYSNRGLAYRLKGELGAAISDQTDALAIAPNFAMAHIRRAITYLADNKPELALADVEDAVRLEPENAFVHADRGAVHRELGEFELAIADYSKAIEIMRRDEIIHDHYNARGYLYLETDQYEMAFADFDRVLYGRTGIAENYVGRCMALLGLGNAERALRDCDRAVSTNSKSADIFVFRGLANLRLGRSPRALADFAAAMRIEPTNPAAIYGRGLVKTKTGDTTGQADIDQAKSMNPDIVTRIAKFGVTQ